MSAMCSLQPKLQFLSQFLNNSKQTYERLIHAMPHLTHKMIIGNIITIVERKLMQKLYSIDGVYNNMVMGLGKLDFREFLVQPVFPQRCSTKFLFTSSTFQILYEYSYRYLL